jgi:hypothetical protein
LNASPLNHHQNQRRRKSALLPAYQGSATALCGSCLAASFMLTGRPALAQEAIRNSMAGDLAAQAMRLHPESLPYTFKTGEFRLLATPSLGIDWNDNVRLSNTDKQDDFILRPLLGLNASYPVTQRNLLALNVTFGYEQYFKHNDLSRWFVQSGSALSFDIFVKDFYINLHDQFSYLQDSAQEALVANTGSYGNFQNTIGASVTWDLRDVNLTLGYDHQNNQSTTQQFESQDRVSELFVGRAGLKVRPELTTGLEGTVSLTKYDQMILNDNTSYTAGLYADWHPSRYLQATARGGYSIFDFQHTSAFIQTGNLDSWYIGLVITHNITQAISYSLSAGHDIRLGIQSDATEETYVTPAITWSIIRGWPFQTSLSFQHGKQGVANQGGNLVENYDWLTLGFGLNHSVTARLGMGINYRLTLRSSSVPAREYTQNLVGLQMTYQLQ